MSSRSTTSLAIHCDYQRKVQTRSSDCQWRTYASLAIIIVLVGRIFAFFPTLAPWRSIVARKMTYLLSNIYQWQIFLKSQVSIQIGSHTTHPWTAIWVRASLVATGSRGHRHKICCYVASFTLDHKYAPCQRGRWDCLLGVTWLTLFIGWRADQVMVLPLPNT